MMERMIGHLEQDDNRSTSKSKETKRIVAKRLLQHAVICCISQYHNKCNNKTDS